jgi:hypothetical protein
VDDGATLTTHRRREHRPTVQKSVVERVNGNVGSPQLGRQAQRALLNPVPAARHHVDRGVEGGGLGVELAELVDLVFVGLVALHDA